MYNVVSAFSIIQLELFQDYISRAQLELLVSLECNADPRQLRQCEAHTSQDWTLSPDTTGDSVSVTVTSLVENSGNMVITVTGQSSKTVNVIRINGLTLRSDSIFQLPGSVQAGQCGAGAELTPCWSHQQDGVILKNIETPLNSGEINISWKY